MAGDGHLIRRLLLPDGAVCQACGRLRTDHPAGLCGPCFRALEGLGALRCPRCGGPGWAGLCPDCAAAPETALAGRHSPYRYDGTARRLILALKYRAAHTAAHALAEGMARAMPPAALDALVPVPLHPRRERRRGFNQALILCQALAPRVGLPVAQPLRRLRDTPTQTLLSPAQRAENMRGAFAAEAAAGQRLLLVDDVLTTGATAEACGRALRVAGAAEVWLLTATRAMGPVEP